MADADYKSFKTKAEADYAFANREEIKAELKAKKKPVYYVVWAGHNPGIYTDWDIARKEIAGYPNLFLKHLDQRNLPKKPLRTA